MNEPDTPADRPSRPDGATTAGKGSPVGVDVTTSRGTKTLLAMLFAGPVIWSAHFLFVYLVVETGCTGDGPGLNHFDPPVPAVATVAATAIAVLACLATAVWAYRRWRECQAEAGHTDGDLSTEPRGSLALAGMMLSLLGVVTVLFVGLPALVLPACLP